MAIVIGGAPLAAPALSAALAAPAAFASPHHAPAGLAGPAAVQPAAGHLRIDHFLREGGVAQAIPLEGPGNGDASSSHGKRSYWFHFTTSIDQAKDVAILKELLFWASIYHQEDSLLRVLFAAPGRRDYAFYQRIFDVSESPCLVMSDQWDYPVNFVKLGKGLFAPEIVGADYSKLRELLESMHTLLNLHGDLSTVSEHVLQERITGVLAKVWNEIKGLVKITVSGKA